MFIENVWLKTTLFQYLQNYLYNIKNLYNIKPLKHILEK